MLKGSAKIQFTVCNFAPIGMKIENNFYELFAQLRDAKRPFVLYRLPNTNKHSQHDWSFIGWDSTFLIDINVCPDSWKSVFDISISLGSSESKMSLDNLVRDSVSSW